MILNWIHCRSWWANKPDSESKNQQAAGRTRGRLGWHTGWSWVFPEYPASEIHKVLTILFDVWQGTPNAIWGMYFCVATCSNNCKDLFYNLFNALIWIEGLLHHLKWISMPLMWDSIWTSYCKVWCQNLSLGLLSHEVVHSIVQTDKRPI